MNTVKANQRLLKLVGNAFGVAAVIGGTIGIGILRTPGSVAALIPDPLWYLAAWLGVGLFTAIGANSLAELATAVPQAGGPYVYARRAFGDYAGFATGWYRWLRRTRPGTAVVAVGEPPG